MTSPHAPDPHHRNPGTPTTAYTRPGPPLAYSATDDPDPASGELPPYRSTVDRGTERPPVEHPPRYDVPADPWTEREPERAPSPTADAGVDVGKFAGGIAFTAVVAALLAGGGAWLLNAGWSRIPRSYWVGEQIVRPSMDVTTATWLGVGAVIVAAALVWLLIKTTPSPASFAAWIAGLVTLLWAAWMGLGYGGGLPWQDALPRAVHVLVVGLSVSALTRMVAAMTATDPAAYGARR